VLFVRNAVLEQAGYSVVQAIGMDEAIRAMDRERFEVAIVGHLYTTEEKNIIAAKAHGAGTKVLCMHSEPLQPDVRNADAFIHNLDGPERLLTAVAALTAKRISA
jgi:hypothetical protein